MTLKNFRTHLLYYIQLCASFQIHWCIQTEVTVRKCSTRVKIGNFLSHVTLKFDGWPWKTIGHLFYTLSSFVHHFKTMGEFKLELQSGNTQFVSKSAIFFHVTLKFDGWPWKSTGHLSYNTSSFVHHFKAMGEFKLELQSGNAHFGSNSAIFCPVRPWNSTNDLDKTIGHLFYVTSSFVHHFTAISELKLELQSGNAQFGSKLMFFVPCDLEIWQITLRTIGHLFYATSSFVHHVVVIGEFKLELQSGNAQFGSKSTI